MRKIKYTGNMKSGLFHTSEGNIIGNKGEWVKVSKNQFEEMVPDPQWEGCWDWKKKKKKIKNKGEDEE